MRRIKPTSFLAAAVVTAVAVTACGGGSNNSTASAPPTTAGGKPATVSVESNSSLGKILVDSQGRTLYLFKRDTGTDSTCVGPCAQSWPPLMPSGKPTVAGGAQASSLGTIRDRNGKTQVTYHGHPLYLFQGDGKPGATNGQGMNAFGAKWYVVSPAGNQITTSSGSAVDSGY